MSNLYTLNFVQIAKVLPLLLLDVTSPPLVCDVAYGQPLDMGEVYHGLEWGRGEGG